MNFLVVDDDQITRGYIARLLRAAFQAQIVEAHDNASAHAAIAESSFDLITTDIYRGGGLGTKLLCHLREDPGTAHVPIIVISGNLRHALATHDGFLRHGLDAAFDKPFN